MSEQDPATGLQDERAKTLLEEIAGESTFSFDEVVEIADRYLGMTQLRTQLADARRIISELEAAQGIAVHELGRQRELAAARLRTIKGLNATVKKLKSEVAVLTELEHRARWPGDYA